MARVKIFPASNGDCFLIRGSGANVLIDGGYNVTFEDHLRPELAQIGLERQRLDLLVATHIDQDHILGIIALLEANGPAVPRAVLEIDAVWFNSLRCLAARVGATLPPQAKRLVGALARQGFQPRPAACP
jgi:glyoxylase-like metal-dependent hydrolase (beta-lactamase superfamily II)